MHQNAVLCGNGLNKLIYPLSDTLNADIVEEEKVASYLHFLPFLQYFSILKAVSQHYIST